MKTTVWNDRIAGVQADPEEARRAAALYWLVQEHLRICQHKRACPEATLFGEACDVVKMADKELGR